MLSPPPPRSSISTMSSSGYVEELASRALFTSTSSGGEYLQDLEPATDYFGDYTALNDGSPNSSSSGMAVAAHQRYAFVNNIKVDDSTKIVLIIKYNTTGADYGIMRQTVQILGVAGSLRRANSNDGIGVQAFQGRQRHARDLVLLRSMALPTTLSPTTTAVYVGERARPTSRSKQLPHGSHDGMALKRECRKGNAQRNKAPF